MKPKGKVMWAVLSTPMIQEPRNPPLANSGGLFQLTEVNRGL